MISVIAIIVGAAGALTAAYVVQARAAKRAEAIAEPLLIGWTTLWPLGIAGLQIDAFVEPAMQRAVWIVSISAIAALDALLAARLAWRNVAMPAIEC